MDSDGRVDISCGTVGIDEACIILHSDTSNNLTFQYQSLECDKCNLTNHVQFGVAGEKVTLDFVSFGTEWRVIREHDHHVLCSAQKTFFQEGSHYNLSYQNESCSVVETKSAPSIYIPLYVALAVYVLLIILWKIGSLVYKEKVWKKFMKTQGSLNELTTAYSSNSFIGDQKVARGKQRLRSLDTVRGIALVIMIFVNYGGGKYWFFHHARWNGLTVADLVFPWFIWMMGMSMALSMRSLLRKSITRQKIFAKIVKRSVILFLLGLMLNTYCLTVDLKDLRISGVLQRFGICYFIVATVHLFFAQAEERPQESHTFPSLRDILPYWCEWLIMILILAAHLLITFFVPVPNCPTGYLGPGGLHCDEQYFNCTGGAAGYIDRIVLGETHLYQRPTFKAIYKTKLPYDPEGLLGYLTSIFLVYLGLQAGKILLAYQTPKARIIRWLAWAVITGTLSIALCKGTKNDGWIPINKNLWSVSYIFATGSMAFLLLSFCYMIIDIQNWWTGAPFFCAGMNSILLYVGHTITHNMFPWSWKVSPNHAEKLAVDLWGTTLWVLIAAWAYHIKFFVTV